MRPGPLKRRRLTEERLLLRGGVGHRSLKLDSCFFLKGSLLTMIFFPQDVALRQLEVIVAVDKDIFFPRSEIGPPVLLI